MMKRTILYCLLAALLLLCLTGCAPDERPQKQPPIDELIDQYVDYNGTQVRVPTAIHITTSKGMETEAADPRSFPDFAANFVFLLQESEQINTHTEQEAEKSDYQVLMTFSDGTITYLIAGNHLTEQNNITGQNTTVQMSAEHAEFIVFTIQNMMEQF